MGKQSSWKARISRREFLLQGAVSAGAVAAPFALGQRAPERESACQEDSNQTGVKRKVIHIVGHSHIDAAWLWPWREGADTVLTTFRSALNRMNETSGFCFSHSSSAHYRWAERADPAMFAEIRQRVREGRWEVVGGWPVEPDCNIPATESFLRHSLYGKQYCRQALGVDVKIGFNPDSFGHSAGLPTILKHAGYSHYVFMRPNESESGLGSGLPLLFWWEGPDGSRILTLRISKTYDAKAEDIPSAAFAPGFDDAAFLLGVGDHGGAVTRAQLQQIADLRKDSALPELRFSTLGAFFARIQGSSAFSDLPVIRGELQHHARGCYSANGEGKYLNRRAERWLGEAETISLSANLTCGHRYPAEAYAESWWKVLFCQFHDMLAGTSLYRDYQEVRDSLGYACETAQTAKVEALERMAKLVDTSKVAESAVFLFNPLPWRRKALIEYCPERDPSRSAPITHLVAQDGKTTPIQWRPAESMRNTNPRLSAWVELPPCGYKVLELAHGAEPSGEAFGGFATVAQSAFGISSFKAADGAELLSLPIGLVVIRDASDTWGHGIRQFREELGRPEFVSSSVIEEGAVTRVTRQRARWQSSEIVLDIAQFAGLDFLELRFVIDWREHEQMLKLEIPTALAKPRLFAKVPGQVLERGTDGDEEPYQDWGAVQGTVDGRVYTLALVNAQTYSYDCLGELLRTVLIRSAPYARHDPWPVPPNDINAWQDQGRQERRFWLKAGVGSYAQLNLDRLAEELQTPVEYVMDSAHGGSEGWEKGLLEISPGNVWAPAIKQAERDPKATIVRVQERSGIATQAKLVSAVLGLDHAIDLAPWQMKTLLVKRSHGDSGSSAKSPRAEVREVSGLET